MRNEHPMRKLPECHCNNKKIIISPNISLNITSMFFILKLGFVNQLVKAKTDLQFINLTFILIRPKIVVIKIPILECPIVWLHIDLPVDEPQKRQPS